MSYPSVDALQRALGEKIFNNRTDIKKAAGRALGTIVELITFYVLRNWKLQKYLSIERGLCEFANDNITHNVEFGLHPLTGEHVAKFAPSDVDLPLTATKIRKKLSLWFDTPKTTLDLLSAREVVRNACTIAQFDDGSFAVANFDRDEDGNYEIEVSILRGEPFAMVECKRVGVEEGARKGPTTIEKAKQGAYVAKHVSALQKIRGRDGKLYGVMPLVDGKFEIRELEAEMLRLIYDAPAAELNGFILTVGVVSNHGNWFTKDNMNKELLVLKQSYDWLLFLTDDAIAEFVSETILSDAPEMKAVVDAFRDSYTSGESGKNVFTKVRINLAAHEVLSRYFEKHILRIEQKWFNVLSPDTTGTIEELKNQLWKLAGKKTL